MGGMGMMGSGGMMGGMGMTGIGGTTWAMNGMSMTGDGQPGMAPLVPGQPRDRLRRYVRNAAKRRQL
jgi:hypothetical protein